MTNLTPSKVLTPRSNHFKLFNLFNHTLVSCLDHRGQGQLCSNQTRQQSRGASYTQPRSRGRSRAACLHTAAVTSFARTGKVTILVPNTNKWREVECFSTKICCQIILSIFMKFMSNIFLKFKCSPVQVIAPPSPISHMLCSLLLLLTWHSTRWRQEIFQNKVKTGIGKIGSIQPISIWIMVMEKFGSHGYILAHFSQLPLKLDIYNF